VARGIQLFQLCARRHLGEASWQYVSVVNDERTPRAKPPAARSVRLRCAFCEQLVEVRHGVVGRVFICFDCVDTINRLRAESEVSAED
jgi:hypothetical protein